MAQTAGTGPRRIVRGVAVIVLSVAGSIALSAAATLVGAQTSPDSTAKPPSGLCFRGQPGSRCTRFLLTEASYSYRLAGTSRTQVAGRPQLNDLGSHFSWEIGVMQNVADRTALGATLMAGTGGAGTRVALKGRYRQWLGTRGTADLSGGVLRTHLYVPLQPNQPNQRFAAPAYGVTGDATLGVSDLVGVTARVELVRGGGRSASAVYGGVRLGSYPAIVASAIGGLALVALVAAISSADF